MRFEKITDITQLKTGLRVYFQFSTSGSVTGRLFIAESSAGVNSDSLIFVCNDTMRGTDCGAQNRFGYQYSFSISAASFLNGTSGLRAVLKEGETL